VNSATFNRIRFEHIGRVLALLLIFWSPFTGGPRVFSALLAIMGGWLVYRERVALFAQPAMQRWLIIFLLLWIPLLLSVPGSFDLSRSFKTVAVLPLYFLVGIALIHSLRRDADRRWLAKGIGLTLALWLADALVQYFLGRDLIGVPLTSDGRIVGAFGDNLHLAVFLAVLGPVGLWLLLPGRDRPATLLPRIVPLNRAVSPLTRPFWALLFPPGRRKIVCARSAGERSTGPPDLSPYPPHLPRYAGEGNRYGLRPVHG